MKFFYMFLILFIFSSLSFCDTIKLKNKYEIFGKLVKETNTKMKIKKGNVRILFKNGGWMDIQKKDIFEVIENDLDQFEMRK